MNVVTSTARQIFSAFSRDPTQRQRRREHAQWQSLAQEISARSAMVQRQRPPRRVLILPPDPVTLVGSRGDEAMIQAAASLLRRAEPALQIAAVVAAPEAERMAEQTAGFAPLRIAARDWTPRAACAALERFQPDAVLALGADVMDGHYGVNLPGRMLITADLAARSGAAATVLGFSFNQTPHHELKRYFDKLDSRVQLNVRDAVSLDRFSRFTRRQARLVADMAFHLEPNLASPAVQELREWARQQQSRGRVVLAFNLNLHLVQPSTRERTHALVQSAATALLALARKQEVSVLLLAHDFRDPGDDACLAPLFEALMARPAAPVRYHSAPLSAAELKAVAGGADAVLTGRMHLAIASLGMGVPVAALTYQDKFQGLFAHFDLPQDLLLAPGHALDAARLERLAADLLQRRGELRQRVAEALPAVLTASAQNLENVL